MFWYDRSKYIGLYHAPDDLVGTAPGPENEVIVRAKGSWHNSAAWKGVYNDYHMYRTVLIFHAGKSGDTCEAEFRKGVSQWKDLRPFVGPCVHYDYDINWIFDRNY